MMMENEQIEEMAEILSVKCNRDCIPSCEECTAQTLYNAGYRKVERGEWMPYSSTMMECSVCKRHTPRHRYNFCPNCGADMRGGDKE